MGLFNKITLRGLIRFFFRRAVEGVIVILILYFLPNIPPFCKFETPFKVSQTLPLEGKLAVNEKLSDVEYWHEGNVYGPEAFATYNGQLYTALHSGEIVKLIGDKQISPIVKFGKPCKHFEESKCGRPLGMVFDKAGSLFAADAYYGIFKVDVKTGEKVQLVSPDVEIEGKKPKLFNYPVVASTGEVYWTDSSTEFALEDGFFDILSDGSGRVIKYDPKTKRNTVLLDKLGFANGLLLSQNEDFLVVAVTNRNLLYKYHLKGSKAGQHEILIEGLPGMPDNLQSDGHGGILLPLITSHDADHPNLIQIFGPFPWIRKLIARTFGLLEFAFKATDYVYPNDIAKSGVHLIGHFSPLKYFSITPRASILHISEQGEILDSFHTTNGKLHAISEAFVYGDDLLLGSPFNEYIGRIPLKKLGLTAPPTPKATAAPTKASSTMQPPKEEVKREVPKQETPKAKTTAAPAKAVPKPVAEQEQPKPQTSPKAIPTQVPTTAPPKPTVKATAKADATTQTQAQPASAAKSKSETPSQKPSETTQNSNNKF